MYFILFNHIAIKVFGLMDAQINIIQQELGSYISVIDFDCSKFEVELNLIGLNQNELYSKRNCLSNQINSTGFYRVFDDVYDKDNFIVTFGVKENNPKLKLYYNKDNNNSAYMIMRIIRSIFLKLSLVENSLFLHASAVVYNGKAIVFTGPKKAGKTTTMLAMLEYTNSAPLTNDKLLLKKNNDSIEVYGFPIRAGIRSGTLISFSTIHERLYRLPKNSIYDDKILRVTMDNLAHLYQRQAIQHSDLGVIFFPIYEPNINEPNIKKLTNKQVEILLAQSVLSEFKDIEPLQTAIQDYFYEPDYSNENIIFKFDVYEIKYNPSIVKEAINEILNILGK
ncbi:hypothetical protein Q5X48_09260 [Acinetobacter baumannii]|nr:hypothetical protein [Acinetobacter baumannii]